MSFGGKHDHGAGGLFRHAACVGAADDHVVVPAVEVFLELDDLALAGVRARQLERHHGGLGAGTGEAHALRGGYEVLDAPAPLVLHVAAAAEVGCLGHLPGDGLDDVRVRVAEYERAVACEVVQYAVAVNVPLGGAFGVGEEQREGPEPAPVVGYAVGEDLARPGVALCGLWMQLDEPLFDLCWHSDDPPRRALTRDAPTIWAVRAL